MEPLIYCNLRAALTIFVTLTCSPASRESSRHPQQPSGFGVVVRADDIGYQARIYNYRLQLLQRGRGFTGSDPILYYILVSDSYGKPFPYIGHLGEGGQYFTVAHIANNLQNLREGSRFIVTV